MDPVTKGKKYMEFKASKDAVSCSHFYIIYIHFPFHVHISYSALNINLKRGLVLRMYNSVALWKKVTSHDSSLVKYLYPLMWTKSYIFLSIDTVQLLDYNLVKLSLFLDVN